MALHSLTQSALPHCRRIRAGNTWKSLALCCRLSSRCSSAELISRKLEITASGLTLRSFFLDRSIPFAGVDSISVKVIDHEQQVVSRVTIRGTDGQKIAFDSDMPCYRAVLSLLRSRRRQAMRRGSGRPRLFLTRPGPQLRAAQWKHPHRLHLVACHTPDQSVCRRDAKTSFLVIQKKIELNELFGRLTMGRAC